MRQIYLLIGLLCYMLQPLTAQNDSTNRTHRSLADGKLMEIKKIITLSPTQKTMIREAYNKNHQTSDSILYNVADATQAAILKYQADKTLQATLMSALTEAQKVKYLTIMGTPDVMAKAEAKVDLLRQNGNYTEQELQQKKQEIFNYLIKEKVVYLRDKFNIAKQKDNIHKLKETEPASLKESESLEKLKAKGKIDKGKINW